MRLNLTPGVEPYPLFDDLDLVVHARPALSEVIAEAKADPALIAYGREHGAALGDSDEISAEAVLHRGRAGLLFTKAVARLVIEDWEGVEDADGTPAPVTAERIDAFLDIPAVFDAFTGRYMGRWLVLQAEKNVSRSAPNGTSAAGRSIAGPARKPVKPVRGG